MPTSTTSSIHIISIALLLSIATTCSAQGTVIGYAITQHGDTIPFYRDPDAAEDAPTTLSMTAASVDYFDKEGKNKHIKQAKLKELYFGGHHFINHSIASMGMDRLQRVVMQNDRYLLTSYFGNWWVFYIYDKNTMEAVEKKVKSSMKPKKEIKILDTVVAKYFGKCTEAMETIRKSILDADYQSELIKGHDAMFGHVSDYHCDEGAAKKR